MERFSALIGFVGILFIAWLMSNNKRAIRWKTIGWGIALQILTAILVLKGEWISSAFKPISFGMTQGIAAAIFVVLAIVIAQIAKRTPEASRRTLWSGFGVVSVYLFLTFNLLGFLFLRMKDVVTNFIEFSDKGSQFVFGPKLADANGPAGFVFAFRVLPTIIFIASIFAILYYVGVMQVVVRFFAKIMSRFMGASGAESTSVAASIFMGQTEAPLTIRPFLPEMTESELMTIMTAGMAHVSGGVMAAYVMMAHVDVVHLLTAVIMTAPGAIMMSKLIVPEVGTPKTGGDVEVKVEQTDVNVIDAAGRGAIEGLHLSLNVAGMLIAFIALIALVDGTFTWVNAHIYFTIGGAQYSILPKGLDLFLGTIFRPIAWAMGVSWKDSLTVGNLLGLRMAVNEFIAFSKLGPIASTLDPRSVVITTYALCGFANFSSIAIQIGGIGSLAPSRRGDLAKLGLRAMLAGTLANFLTATIAGMLL